MASPFQQQVRQRKFIYLGLIIVLFTVSIVWRTQVVDRLAEPLAIREHSRGDVELLGAVVRLGLTGSRGIVSCVLWDSAMEKQKLNQWNELEVLVRIITRLQPHFVTPWLFQSWNLSYNVSVESDRVRDKYFYMTKGINLLAEGERQNRNQPEMRWSIGFFLQSKICTQDETNYLRSLFQLSLIPPNERDPARFWKQTNAGAEFNWVEFKDFCNKHPQLIRRLNRGIHRTTVRDKKLQFTCERAENIVQFLDDNYSIPSMYEVRSLTADTAQTRGWDRATKDTLLAATSDERFPPLPAPHEGAFDPTALSSSSTLDDRIDAYAVSHAWFCYSQETLPPPDKMPGSTAPITDRTVQRLPKKTTLIFRHHPPIAKRMMAERLQQEGWFDGEGFDITHLFPAGNWQALGLAAGTPAVRAVEVSVEQRVVIGAGVKWSLDAWIRARDAWKKHGDDNHLLLSPAEEQNKRELARAFFTKLRLPESAVPPLLAREELDSLTKREYDAAHFIYNYEYYRRLTNFHHQFVRANVEALPETIQCNKFFYKAEQAHLDGHPYQAIKYWETPSIEAPDGKGKKLDPLTAWRDLILLRNKEFRRDHFTKQLNGEIELRYLIAWNRKAGVEMKNDLVRAATVLPLIPKFDPELFPDPIVQGPFDVNDDEGVPLIDVPGMEVAMQRVGLRKRQPSGQKPSRPSGRVPQPTPRQKGLGSPRD